jgi:pyruvate formate lyase activating enzyme
MHPEPRREFYAKMDAANVDLKAFSDDFYEKITFSKRSAVLDTLEYLARETKVWTEITTLLIPGHNDSEAEITEECEWLASHLGPDIPLHFTAFHPDYKMTDIPPTPASTLRRAREIARRAGLHFVYTGNVHDAEGGTTYCTGCKAPLVVRDWYEILDYRLTADGRCPDCGAAAAGRYDARPGSHGRRRTPVVIQTH